MYEHRCCDSIAEENINKKLSLKDLLGEGWEHTIFFNSVESALGIDTDGENEFSQRINLSQDNISERQEIIRAIFFEMMSRFPESRISYVRLNSQHRILVEYCLSKTENVIQVINPHTFTFFPGLNKPTSYQVEKLLITNTITSATTDLCGLMRVDEHIRFSLPKRGVELYGEDKGVVRKNGNVETITCPAPRSREEFRTLIHEMGHIFRSRAIRSLGDRNVLAEKIAKDEFEAGRPQKLKKYTSKQLVVSDERTAWAIAISIMREAARITGLSFADEDHVHEAILQANNSLRIYDINNVYSHDSDNGTNMLPAFSDEQRKAARQIQSLFERFRDYGVKLVDIPMFYENTPTASDPQRILQLLFKPDRNFLSILLKNSKERKQKADIEYRKQIEFLMERMGLTIDMIPKTDKDGNIVNTDNAQELLDLLSKEGYIDIARRRLEEIKNERGLNTLPKYDDKTGEYIYDDPRKMIQALLSR